MSETFEKAGETGKAGYFTRARENNFPVGQKLYEKIFPCARKNYPVIPVYPAFAGFSVGYRSVCDPACIRSLSGHGLKQAQGVAMDVTEVQQKLQQWGEWLRSGGVRLGYGVNALAMVEGGGLPPPPLSDEEALAVDRVLATLKRFNLEQYQCIYMAYAALMSNRAISKALGMSPMSVQRRIEAAEEWVGRMLCVREKVVAK